jgi:hypothetical protein
MFPPRGRKALADDCANRQRSARFGVAGAALVEKPLSDRDAPV